MYYQYLKAVQVVVLILTAIQTQHFLMLICTLFLALYTQDKYYIGTSLSIVISLLPYIQALETMLLIPFLLNGLILLLLKWKSSRMLTNDKLLPLLLLLFSLTTINDDKLAANIQLGVFYLLLILYYLQYIRVLIFLVKIIRFVVIIQLATLSFFTWIQHNQQPLYRNQAKWYYLSFALSAIFCSFISQQQLSLTEKYSEQNSMNSNRSLLSMDSIQIQLIQMKDGKNNQNSGNAGNAENLGNQQVMPNILLEERQSQIREPKQKKNKLQEQQQSQSLNLFLVIPFCLLNQGWFQIPIYFYILSLQWSFTRKWIFVGMLLSLAIISSRTQTSLFFQLALRILGVLLVTKNLQGGPEVGELIKVIWLRTSFSVVLSILFWFSLLTVNIFHLLFIAIILVFITQDSQPNTVSYRHKNWKYLVLLFNIFLLLRFVYQTAVENGWQPGQWFLHLLQLTGIFFQYSSTPTFFNLVPLLINAIIGLQYLTYNSKIYSIHSKSKLLQPYRALFLRFAGILTIIYYKLLPWASYLTIIGILLALEFSVSSFILLAWILLTLSCHILGKNNLVGYRRLYFFWLVYARLTSLQIVLRYIFQFAKFELLAFLRGLPLFQVLLRYEQLLGLAIRSPDEVYLKTVNKFQLMVSLDLLAIFVAFLITEYYTLLLKYQELPLQAQWSPQQRRVHDLYHEFIDFKLTTWMRGFPIYRGLKLIGTSFFELFFPALGLLACLNFSVLMFLYLLLASAYYLSINLAFYQTYIESGSSRALLGLLVRWHSQEVSPQIQRLNSRLIQSQNFIKAFKVQQHNRIRPAVLVVTIISILLTYFSNVLVSAEATQILNERWTLLARWWLFVGGCSVQQGFSSHFSKLILICLVLEMKCSWFIFKFQLAENLRPDWLEEALVQEILTNGNDSYAEMEDSPPPLDPVWAQNSSQVGLNQSEAEREGERQVVEMQISFLLGVAKLVQRSFVMVLVFASIVEGSHPFGIVYLLAAILLNYLGSVSIKTLSRLLCALIILEYLFVLANYSNSHLFKIPAIFHSFQQQTILDWLFDLPPEWEWYLTFGKSSRQVGMLAMSWLIIVCYQFYFMVLRSAWKKVLLLLQSEPRVSNVGKRLLEHVRQVYQYGLTYSPLAVMLLCLAIYLLDYSVTNFLLTTLTTGFIFLSFMVRDYRDSRHFWRTYFMVLQFMIVCFMLIYSLLQLPMLSQFCTRLLCAQEELQTQIYKAVLLLILQLGLDLTNSHHFERALRHFQRSHSRINVQRLAIAHRNNNRKVEEKFKQLRMEQELLETVDEVQIFLNDLKQDPQLQFGRKGQNYQSKQSWVDVFIQFLPSLIDQHLLLNEQQAKALVENQNRQWIKLKDFGQWELPRLIDSYIDEFADLQGEQLQHELRNIIKTIDEQNQQPSKMLDEKQNNLSHIAQETSSIPQQRQKSELGVRKSLHFSQMEDVELHPSQRRSYAVVEEESSEIVQTIRASLISGDSKQKQQLLYLLLVESVLSNWQYITYLVLILVHVYNLGLLTFPLATVTFCFALVGSYQAGKQVWRWLFVLVLVPLLFKFIVKLGLINLSAETVYLLIGDNLDSALLQYLGVVGVVGQCIILKMIGHFHETTQEIECMKMALVRKIINDGKPDQRPLLFALLRQSRAIPVSFTDFLFGVTECKPGYDYSTLLTSLQLSVLVWVFLFYDRMAVSAEVTFYQMIQYNQFSSGMVALTLLQLIFLLSERFIAIADLKDASKRWDIGLLLKYFLLIINLIVVESVILLYFPLSSGQYRSNSYVTVLLIMSLLSLLIQALQVKKGLDQASRGFMDRYTWYNGFVYIGYRAIPFLFQFKAFSDWTFTKTSLRIFDWIRLEEIFGRLYVAKCNSLFMMGKLMGSKIQWWKKLLMGYPLLLSIILLLFGPLVLFSSLNPLAAPNDVIAGYLEVTLRVNHTNEYPLYTNSHITDIHRLQPNQNELTLLKTYDIDLQAVQILSLEQFSDQYWEISEGSYYKLLSQAETSLYQLLVRAKFDRNQTGTTSLYVLNNYEVPSQRVLELKGALLGKNNFCVNNLIKTFLRLDNNNGLHQLGEQSTKGCLRATAGVRATKQYWILEGGLRLRVASDKYTKAIFGYSVMSFYISIILVIANYFRFLFQGSVHTILTTDIPYPDPILALCNDIFRARRMHDLMRQQHLFWMIIDLLRSPDSVKSLTGRYLQARLDTLTLNQQKAEQKED